MTTAHDSIQSLRDELRARSERHKLLRGILYGIIISASLWIALGWAVAHADEPVQNAIVGPYKAAQTVTAYSVDQTATRGTIELKGSCPACGHRKAS